MTVTGPKTGFTVVDPNTSTAQDIGNRYVSKDYLLDVYPNLVPGRTSPGLWSIGRNVFGQLGQGNQTDYSSPVQVGALTNWKQISGGAVYSVGIKTDGTLWSWGYNSNSFGQLGQGNTTSVSSPVQVGALTNWKQISGGAFHSIAIKTDGTLWTWGSNVYGELGLGDITNRSSPVQVGALTNWKLVSGGVYYTAAIKTDGTLWLWGYNNYGQLGQGNTTYYSSPVQVGSLTNWKLVSCGAYYTTAIKTDGTLWSWGCNAYGHGQLGQGNTTSVSSPVQVGALTNWKLVCGGNYYTAAIKTDGTLWSWGKNSNGQLGQGNTTSVSSPVQVGALTNWKSVAVTNRGDHMVAIKTDGTLWSWGYNNYGQLGQGNRTSYSSPVQVGSLTNWKQVASLASSTEIIQDGYL